VKKLAAALVTLTCLLAVHPARAEIGTADAVPAATLLLPYFEVDLGNPNGVTTLFSVNNASATAVVANVTIWTDWGVPSLGFQLYLTGYDVQTMNLRTIFGGTLPVTADAGSDPSDTLSHKGPLSQDINFPGAVGPCGSSQTTYNNFDPTLALKIQNIQRVHQGLSSPVDGKCWGANHGDAVVRGYITVDTVNQCGLSGPADAGYMTNVITNQNVLWGDYSFVNPAKNIAYGDTLVHVEACNGGGFQGFVGNGAGNCPFTAGDYTFYGRYDGANASDQREPLATTFAARYATINKTDLLVWRDTKKAPSGADGKQTCGGAPAWFPLSQSDVVGFDTQENVDDLCILPNDTSPASSKTCFPLATERVNVKSGNALAKKMMVPFDAGWLYLNLNHEVSSDPFPGVAQAWVSVVRSGEGQFSTGQGALQLDNALTAPDGGVTIP
jgi:hypothetical protein